MKGCPYLPEPHSRNECPGPPWPVLHRGKPIPAILLHWLAAELSDDELAKLNAFLTQPERGVKETR